MADLSAHSRHFKTNTRRRLFAEFCHDKIGRELRTNFIFSGEFLAGHPDEGRSALRSRGGAQALRVIPTKFALLAARSSASAVLKEPHQLGVVVLVLLDGGPMHIAFIRCPSNRKTTGTRKRHRRVGARGIIKPCRAGARLVKSLGERGRVVFWLEPNGIKIRPHQAYVAIFSGELTRANDGMFGCDQTWVAKP
jgi:hypothetical protein